MPLFFDEHDESDHGTIHLFYLQCQADDDNQYMERLTMHARFPKAEHERKRRGRPVKGGVGGRGLCQPIPMAARTNKETRKGWIVQSNAD